jgi:hypothetical protein
VLLLSKFNKTYSFTLKTSIIQNWVLQFLFLKQENSIKKFFYVEDIRHEFIGTSQRVEIYLRLFLIPYFHFQHQALEESKMGIPRNT